MAWFTKYRLEIADNLGVIWKTDIQENVAVQGAITNLIGSGSPLNFDFYGDDDIFNQNILGSKVDIEVICHTDFEFDNLFTSNNLQYKVIIYNGAPVYWNGHLLINYSKEPYDCVPYLITLTATDGLGILKDFNFVDLGYTTRQKTSKVIFDILSLVGITSFSEYVNLFDSTMASGTDDSPIDQIGIDPELFLTDDCYKALETILFTLNAGIRQDKGVFTIFRFRELKDATMYGRIFTSGTAKSSTTKTPAQYLNRVGQASNFRDYEGGTKLQLPQLKTLYLNYDLGVKKSCLKHWDFKFDNFVYAVDQWTIPHWIIGSNDMVFPTNDYSIGDYEGIYLNKYSSALTTGVSGYFIEQIITDIKTRSPNFTLSIDTKLHNSVFDVVYAIYFYLYIVGESTKYWDGTNKVWVNIVPALTNTPKITQKLELNGVSWQTTEFIINSVPIDGDLYLRLFAVYSVNATNVRISFKNILLKMTPAVGPNDAGIGYTVSSAPNGQVITRDYRLGDGLTSARIAVNQLINYHGILNGYSGANIIDPGTVWHTRGNIENRPLIEVVGGELGGQYERPKQIIDLPLYETNANSYLSVVANLQDTLNKIGGVNRIFGIAGGKYDVKNRAWKLSITEIL